jgi:nucleotide-binding universal stress UspA family protein
MKLLVAVDLSEATQIIVDKVMELCRTQASKIWILHNAEPPPDVIEFKVDPLAARKSLAIKFHKEHGQIQEIADRLREADLDATALLVHGPTVETILKEASDLDVDMIVVGAHGKGAMHELLVGSVSKGILHKSNYPVLVIPTHRHR